MSLINIISIWILTIGWIVGIVPFSSWYIWNRISKDDIDIGVIWGFMFVSIVIHCIGGLFI